MFVSIKSRRKSEGYIDQIFKKLGDFVKKNKQFHFVWYFDKHKMCQEIPKDIRGKGKM